MMHFRDVRLKTKILQGVTPSRRNDDEQARRHHQQEERSKGSRRSNWFKKYCAILKFNMDDPTTTAMDREEEIPFVHQEVLVGDR
jgi:hypothetical protein